eukprot:SAG11_NODE_22613_length_403_cov_0.546053_1_plen_32_part_01
MASRTRRPQLLGTACRTKFSINTRYLGTRVPD